MKSKWVELTCEVEVGEGEPLMLPDSVARVIGPGRWIVNIQPAEASSSRSGFRDHGAFLRSYGPEDDGLYEDAPVR